MRNVEVIPNPDIFQYIGDGAQYLQLKLPDSIHPPPLAPIVITGLSKMVKGYISYPELEVAKFLNISLSSLSLVLIYLLISPITSSLYAFLIVILTATNQIFRLYSMGITNDATYSFFLVASLYFYTKTKNLLRYLPFGILFLLRYESIVIPIAIFLTEYFSTKRLPKIKCLFFSFTPIILWLIVLNFHSQGHSIVENAYLNEIWSGLKNIPNLKSITSLVDLLIQDSTLPTNQNWFFAFIFIGIYYLTIAQKKPQWIIVTTYLIFGFHLLFLFIFPNFSLRYFTPVIWIFYLILTNFKSKVVTFTVISCLLIYNLFRINTPSNIYHPFDMAEYKLTADWFNSKSFSNPVIVVMFEPHILKYFVTNPHVNVLYDTETPFAICKDEISCIAKTIKKNSKVVPDIYVITSSYTQNQLYEATDKFTAKAHHVDAFSHDTVFNRPDYKYVGSVVDEHYNWANIYKYTETK